MKKIQKRTARRAYNAGATLVLVPCNCRPNSMLFSGFVLDKAQQQENPGQSADFDELVNELEYYNCNRETGKYAAYYLQTPPQA